MNTIRNLIDCLKKDTFADRYPQVHVNDGAVHVLYFEPYLNGTGLHRFIAPSIHLNTTPSHRSAVTGIRAWGGKNTAAHEQEIKLNQDIDQLLKWAHYIVFPTFSHDIKPMLEGFLGVNPRLQFVMDIDDLIHDIPAGNPLSNYYSNATKAQLITNMNYMKLVTGTTEHLLSYYQDLIDPQVELFLLPNLMSSMFWEDIDQTAATPRSPEQLPKGEAPPKILLNVNPLQFMDVNPLRKLLQEARREADFELLLFGWNGTDRKTLRNCLQGIPHTHIPSVPVMDYFKKMHSLQADFAIMPLRDNSYNRAKSHHKLLQYAMLGIPAIVADVPTYTDFIKDQPEGDDFGIVQARVAKSNREWIDHIIYMCTWARSEQLAEINANNAKLIQKNGLLNTQIYRWCECFC